MLMSMYEVRLITIVGRRGVIMIYEDVVKKLSRRPRRLTRKP